MKLGLQITRFDWPGSPENIGTKLVEIAQAAEQAGFSTLWVMDHFFQIGGYYGPMDAPMLEGYSTMSYLAAVTQKIKVGLEVTSALYRHPGVMLKTVTTLDVLSGGRACLGIGAGWDERETRGLGIPFPPLKERFERLEETLQIAHQMWRDDRAPFMGRHYQLEAPINRPQPLSKPHPPIMIGGEGERRTLRLVAKYGDMCSLSLGSPLENATPRHHDLFETRVERLSHKLEVLKAHCDDVGRDFSEIEPTVHGPIDLSPGAMTPADVVEICRELKELGFRHYIFNLANAHEIETIGLLGSEVLNRI